MQVEVHPNSGDANVSASRSTRPSLAPRRNPGLVTVTASGRGQARFAV